MPKEKTKRSAGVSICAPLLRPAREDPSLLAPCVQAPQELERSHKLRAAVERALVSIRSGTGPIRQLVGPVLQALLNRDLVSDAECDAWLRETARSMGDKLGLGAMGESLLEAWLIYLCGRTKGEELYRRAFEPVHNAFL